MEYKESIQNNICPKCTGELKEKTHFDESKARSRALRNNTYYFMRWKRCMSCPYMWMDDKSKKYPNGEMSEHERKILEDKKKNWNGNLLDFIN